jgi:hypothetical protein
MHSRTPSSSGPSMKRIATSMLLVAATISFAQPAPDGWTPMAPRDEIEPAFAFDAKSGILTIRADDRDGLHGWWQKSVPIAIPEPTVTPSK